MFAVIIIYHKFRISHSVCLKSGKPVRQFIIKGLRYEYFVENSSFFNNTLRYVMIGFRFFMHFPLIPEPSVYDARIAVIPWHRFFPQYSLK